MFNFSKKLMQKLNSNSNNTLMFQLSCILIALFILTFHPADTVQAASGLKLYNYSTKKETTYTDKQLNVTLNGKKISNSKTPGILVTGYALLPYTEVFENSSIAATCNYNKKKGTLSISKYNSTISMKIGSKKATVNGKAVTLPVAPIKMKYVDTNVEAILVPSRSVSEALGLGYTWISAKSTVAIEKKSMLLSFNNGKKFEYTGAKGNVTIDGKKLDLGSMPSIITNNTAMLRAKKVFADSSIAAKYKYSKADNKVTLSKDGNVLVMTIGSKTAYLNDKPMTMDTAPILVTNHDTNSSYVMVPGGFTASCLGYTYNWDNPTRTSQISTKKSENTSGDPNTDPELGDSGVVLDTGTILYQWNGLETLFGKSNEVHEIGSTSTAPPTVGYIYSVNRDYNNTKKNSETFIITASSPFDKLKAVNTGNKIIILAENMSSTDQIYQVYGASSYYMNSISTYYDMNKQSTNIEFDVRTDQYKYDISLSADKTVLYVTVYTNAITAVSLGNNKSGDYITLSGIDPLKANIFIDTNTMYLDFPLTANGIGDVYTDIAETNSIKQLFIYSNTEKTQVIISLNSGFDYYIIENENKFSIVFRTKEEGTVSQPEIPQPELPQSEIPQVTDKSKYEITIPRPEGITSSAVSHEDFYFKNYFVIRLKGNYTDFFNSHPIIEYSNEVNQISVSLNSIGETEIKVSTTKLQGYEIAWDNENIYVNVGNPRDIYKNIVMLDPGHGGDANGAQYFGAKEKDINFHILYTIGKKYFNQDTSKLKVYYTRTTDVDLLRTERAALSKKVGADLFVSLHMNASVASYPSGTEVYYSKNNNTANAAGLTSKIFASYFQTSLVQSMGTENRGVKEDAFTVIYRNTVPAVLIELGFLSNSDDFSKLSNPEYQELAAKTIYDTLIKVFNDYPTGR